MTANPAYKALATNDEDKVLDIVRNIFAVKAAPVIKEDGRPAGDGDKQGRPNNQRIKGRSMLLLPALTLVCFTACSPLRKATPRTHAAKAPLTRLSADQEKRIEQIYFKAVGTYSNNDMGGTTAYLKEIFAIAPSYQPALDLKHKIDLATGKP